jgi:hypothetical protein
MLSGGLEALEAVFERLMGQVAFEAHQGDRIDRFTKGDGGSGYGGKGAENPINHPDCTVEMFIPDQGAPEQHACCNAEQDHGDFAAKLLEWTEHEWKIASFMQLPRGGWIGEDTNSEVGSGSAPTALLN